MCATTNNGFVNFRAGNHYWGKLGRQAWEATGAKAFGNFRGGNHYWGKLGRQAWEAAGRNGFGSFRVVHPQTLILLTRMVRTPIS